jgi:SAM-dependent methyltransferase
MIVEAKDKNQISFILNRLMRQQNLVTSLRAELLDETDIGKENVLDHIKSSAWATAIPPYMLMLTHEEHRLRAYAIMDKFFPDVKDKRFLDYGCGDGLVVAEARRRGADAVGYDPFPAANWSSDCVSTMPKGTFDCILVYDVMDHAIGTHHIDMMAEIASVAHRDTVVKVRIHPWTSRHGSHCYRFFNKAFVHLLFTPAELRSIGQASQAIPTIPIMNPHIHYEGVFRASGWNIVKVEGVYDEVEPFFTDNPAIRKRFPVTPEVMRISFLDYELVRA